MMEEAYDRFLLQWCSAVWTAETLRCRVHSDNWLWVNESLRHSEWMCNMAGKRRSAECNAERTVKPQWLTSDFIQIALRYPVFFLTQTQNVRRIFWPHKYTRLCGYVNCGFNIEEHPSLRKSPSWHQAENRAGYETEGTSNHLHPSANDGEFSSQWLSTNKITIHSTNQRGGQGWGLERIHIQGAMKYELCGLPNWFSCKNSFHFLP